MLRRLLPIALAVSIAACGGGGGSVDGAEVQASLTSFAHQQSARMPGLGVPVYDRDDHVVMAAANGADDADELCAALAKFLVTKGFDGLDVTVSEGLGGPTLATGTSGKGC